MAAPIMPKKVMKLPRLRTKDELVKIAPELFAALLPEEAEATAAKGKGGRPRSGALDAFDISEPISEEQALAMELEKVKTERGKLLAGIAACKEEVGIAGGEAQEAQIRALLQELALKKAKLNELLLEAARKENTLQKHADETRDCALNTPAGAGPQLAYIEALKAEAEALLTDLQDADAKNRLYMLLADRTRREHLSIDMQVQGAQGTRKSCLDDHATLSAHLGAERSAKDIAER